MQSVTRWSYNMDVKSGGHGIRIQDAVLVALLS